MTIIAYHQQTAVHQQSKVLWTGVRCSRNPKGSPEDTKELAGLLVFGPSLGVLLQIRIDVRCVESPAISISLDPTSDSSSSWVGHRLVASSSFCCSVISSHSFIRSLRESVSRLDLVRWSRAF